MRFLRTVPPNAFAIKGSRRKPASAQGYWSAFVKIEKGNGESLFIKNFNKFEWYNWNTPSISTCGSFPSAIGTPFSLVICKAHLKTNEAHWTTSSEM